jgi:hypothetical protein
MKNTLIGQGRARISLRYPVGMTRPQPLEPIPLRTDPDALRERNVKALVRAGIASARAKTIETGFSDIEVVRKNRPQDDAALGRAPACCVLPQRRPPGTPR